ncbi:hypothetical protein P153DRAFT_362655 [Dothidotthia symphoricarpi CBS 119687]|uniref:BZIP domain-containing protein n=1 Tax=Dothidotthia symphoricarpi CBS 119687 TaxID=1392245 RepID=A0A6A6AUQ0_9PLEO|nr:uncharacterized protein P153DRAFT_362655 [Dothidotthia symphoricarpi CBS 119687]KAF2134943.1 hypothetical protein P153DRAFT_362655 [Dothidotthia symphoricarpi CBS 119687]
MTEIQTLPSSFDWATDAFVALNDPQMGQAPEKWAAFSGPGSSHNQSFAIPPSLLSHASIARYGQVTPPEENLSPVIAESTRHSDRESSIPIEQLRNETLWPHNDLQSYERHPQRAHSPPQQDDQERSPKRRRTSRQAAANQTQSTFYDPAQQQDASANPQPAKRKRGRPKSQPQMVEAYTADGFPFQVSSARQSHLEKNRVAAHKCRQRKKEYIGGLEGRAREFSTKNKQLKENVAMLREEVLSLKNEVLRHAGCGFWAVDEYLARCAGDLLGMEAPTSTSRSPGLRFPNQTQDTAMPTMEATGRFARKHSSDSMNSEGTAMSSPGSDEFGGLELLKDYEEDMDKQE